MRFPGPEDVKRQKPLAWSIGTGGGGNVWFDYNFAMTLSKYFPVKTIGFVP